MAVILGSPFEFSFWASPEHFECRNLAYFQLIQNRASMNAGLDSKSESYKQAKILKKVYISLANNKFCSLN